MSEPRRWTSDEFARDAEQALATFRQWRQTETLGLYSEFVSTFLPVFDQLIDQIPRLASNPLDLELLAATIRDEDLRTAFRYLAAPPVSEDDLKTLADSNLAPTTLRTQRAEAERVRDAVLRIIDPHRFGWLVDGRKPSDGERTRAVVASAVLVAVRKVETSRRGNAKRFQERAVKELLRQAGLDEAEPRDIPLLDAAPAPGQFCGESKLGGTRADIVVRLYDGRVMPIECKVSNSAVNSFKRINHEAAGRHGTGYPDSVGDRSFQLP